MKRSEVMVQLALKKMNVPDVAPHVEQKRKRKFACKAKENNVSSKAKVKRWLDFKCNSTTFKKVPEDCVGLIEESDSTRDNSVLDEDYIPSAECTPEKFENEEFIVNSVDSSDSFQFPFLGTRSHLKSLVPLSQPGITSVIQTPIDVTVNHQPLHLSNVSNIFEKIVGRAQFDSLKLSDVANTLTCQSQSLISVQQRMQSAPATCVSESSATALQASVPAACQLTSTEQPAFATSDSSVPIIQPSRKTKHNTNRPCSFCGVMQTNLKRHLMSKHRNEDQVIDASREENKVLRNAKFDKLRKDGIYNFNRNELRNSGDTDVRIQRERSSNFNKQPTVYCTVCLGFYSSAYFHTHRKLCIKSTESVEILPRPAKSDLLAVNMDTTEDFKTEILSKFQNNEIGKTCRTDECIMLFGSRLFEKMKQKQDKAVEVKRSVMQDMRRVAHLYIKFRDICNAVSPTPVPCASSAEMLVRSNFDILREAITCYTTNAESNDLKSGLKNAIYFLILKLAKVQKAIYLVQAKDEKASEVEKFLEVLGLYQNLIFGDARYNINRNHQVKLRRPQQMPSEEEVLKLKTYTVQRMASIVTDEYLNWNVQSFVELRDLTMSRLTLFNARRGGEPARMTVQEWEDADNGVWLDPSRRPRMDEVDQGLFRDLKITFQGGKGNNHFVSILFPEDCYESMRKLSDPEVRACAEVRVDNKYMFPCTQSSVSHVSGWHAVNRVCKDAGIESPELLTATKMRHRISTLYAGLDVPEKDRQQFYRHMGHGQEINEHVYQTPLAEAAILRVGIHLKTMDGNYNENTTIQTPTSSGNALILGPSDSFFQSADDLRTNVVTCNTSPAVSTYRTISDLTADLPSQVDSENIPAPKKKQDSGAFAKWSADDTRVVREHFRQLIAGGGCTSKAEILKFQNLHPDMTHTWKQIRSKIDNEKRNATTRSANCLHKMSR